MEHIATEDAAFKYGIIALQREVVMGAVRKEEYLPHYTYEDYKEWEGKWELLFGTAYAMAPAPMIEHQTISGKIHWSLMQMLFKCKECQALLPVDWKIAEDTIVQPDNLVICDKSELKKAYLSKTPKIIFEVISPSTAKKDEHLKFTLYESEGVEYYILVYPKEQLAKVYKLHDGRYIKAGDFHDENFSFQLKECQKELTFEFAKLWE